VEPFAGGVVPLMDVGLSITGLGGAQVTELSASSTDAVPAAAAPQTSSLLGGEGSWEDSHTGWTSAAGGGATFVRGGLDRLSTIGEYTISGYGIPEVTNGVDIEGTTEVSSDVTPDAGPEAPVINLRGFTASGGGGAQISNGQSDIELTLALFQVQVTCPSGCALNPNAIVVQNPIGVRVNSVAWLETGDGLWQTNTPLVPGDVTIQVPKTAVTPTAGATKTLEFSVMCPAESYYADGQCRQVTTCGNVPKSGSGENDPCCPQLSAVIGGGRTDLTYSGAVDSCSVVCKRADEYMNVSGACASRVPSSVDDGQWYRITSAGRGSALVDTAGNLVSVEEGTSWEPESCPGTDGVRVPSSCTGGYWADCSGSYSGGCAPYSTCPGGDQGIEIGGGALTDVTCCPSTVGKPLLVYDSPGGAGSPNADCRATCRWGWYWDEGAGACVGWEPNGVPANRYFGAAAPVEPTGGATSAVDGYIQGSTEVSADAAGTVSYTSVTAGTPFASSPCPSLNCPLGQAQENCAGWNPGNCVAWKFAVGAGVQLPPASGSCLECTFIGVIRWGGGQGGGCQILPSVPLSVSGTLTAATVSEVQEYIVAGATSADIANVVSVPFSFTRAKYEGTNVNNVFTGDRGLAGNQGAENGSDCDDQKATNVFVKYSINSTYIATSSLGVLLANPDAVPALNNVDANTSLPLSGASWAWSSGVRLISVNAGTCAAAATPSATTAATPSATTCGSVSPSLGEIDCLAGDDCDEYNSWTPAGCTSPITCAADLYAIPYPVGVLSAEEGEDNLGQIYTQMTGIYATPAAGSVPTRGSCCRCYAGGLKPLTETIPQCLPGVCAGCDPSQNNPLKVVAYNPDYVGDSSLEKYVCECPTGMYVPTGDSSSDWKNANGWKPGKPRGSTFNSTKGCVAWEVDDSIPANFPTGLSAQKTAGWWTPVPMPEVPCPAGLRALPSQGCVTNEYYTNFYK